MLDSNFKFCEGSKLLGGAMKKALAKASAFFNEAHLTVHEE